MEKEITQEESTINTENSSLFNNKIPKEKIQVEPIVGIEDNHLLNSVVHKEIIPILNSLVDRVYLRELHLHEEEARPVVGRLIEQMLDLVLEDIPDIIENHLKRMVDLYKEMYVTPLLKGSYKLIKDENGNDLCVRRKMEDYAEAYRKGDKEENYK